MSGFFTVIHFDDAPIESSLIEQMMGRIRFRGPETESLWQDTGIAIGFTQMKVSIFDQADQQPLQNDQFVIAADTRLYGRDDLCRALRSAGQEATSDMPDSVLILHAFQAWGERCLDYFIGEFAFVIWDKNKRSIFAARDQIGNRTLFYARVGSKLIISNVLGAIRQHPAVSPALNELAIADFLLFADPAWEDKSSTSFRDIFRVKPAHLLKVDANSLNTQRYWVLPLNEEMLRFKTRKDYIEAFRTLLRQVIKERLQVERALITLSGGMDSTSIAALAVDLLRAGEISTELATFTTTYDRIHPDTEAFYALRVAQMWDLPIHFFPVDNFTLRENIPSFIEPALVYQPNLIKTLIHEQWQYGQALLIGHGSDEILFETPLFQLLRDMPAKEAFELYRWLWRFDKKRPSMGGLSSSLRHQGMANFLRHAPEEVDPFPAWVNEEFANTHHLRERWHEHWTRKPVYEHKLHPQGYRFTTLPSWETGVEFYDGSTPSMGVISAPFLDIRMMRFAMQLPPTPWNNRKYILRQAMKNYLPMEVLQRPKTPLGSLLPSLLGHPDAAWVDHWQPIPMLERYVRRENIPPIYGNAADAQEQYVNIRPMYLNKWLEGYVSRP